MKKITITKQDIIEIIKKRWWIVLLELVLVAIVLIADQLSKEYAFLAKDVDVIIPGLLDMRHEYNTGGGWSIFSDNMQGLTIVTTIVVIGLFIYLLIAQKENEWLRVSLVFIASGGIGNLIDRYASLKGDVDYFGVRDFIQFAFWDEFPVFNIADSFVVIGAFMLIIVLVIMMIQEGKASQKKFEEEQANKKEEEPIVLKEENTDSAKKAEDDNKIE